MKRIMSITALITALFLTISCRFITFDNNAISSLDQIVEISDDDNEKSRGSITGSGQILTKEFAVEQFSGIELSLPADVRFEYTDGDPSISVRTHENIFELLKIDSRNGALTLKIARAKRYNIEELDVVIRSSELNSISINGACDFETEEILKGENLNVSVAGAGDIELFGIEAGNSQIAVAGAGDISISNCNAETLRLSIAGAGEADIDNADCRYISVSLAGAGEIDLNGKADKVDLAIAGVGNIDISDMAITELNQEIKGIGSVIR